MTIGRRAVTAAIAMALAGRRVRAATESLELRISYLEGFGFLPNQVARQRQLIEKHAAALGLPGVAVTWQSLRSAVIATDALLSGQLDWLLYRYLLIGSQPDSSEYPMGGRGVRA